MHTHEICNCKQVGGASTRKTLLCHDFSERLEISQVQGAVSSENL